MLQNQTNNLKPVIDISSLRVNTLSMLCQHTVDVYLGYFDSADVDDDDDASHSALANATIQQLISVWIEVETNITEFFLKNITIGYVDWNREYLELLKDMTPIVKISYCRGIHISMHLCYYVFTHTFIFICSAHC